MGIRSFPGAATAAFVATLVCGACSAATVPQALPTGSYVATTLNGGSLPAVVSLIGADTIRVTATTMAISMGNLAAITQTYSVNSGAVQSITGTWKIRANGDDLYFDAVSQLSCTGVAVCASAPAPVAVEAPDKSYIDASFQNLSSPGYVLRLRSQDR